MRKIGQLKNADYAIEESDVAQMKHGSWNFLKLLKTKSSINLYLILELNMYVKKWKEVVIEDCESKAAEINIINYKS